MIKDALQSDALVDGREVWSATVDVENDIKTRIGLNGFVTWLLGCYTVDMFKSNMIGGIVFQMQPSMDLFSCNRKTIQQLINSVPWACTI